MPFKSEAQRRLFYAKQNSGEISMRTVKEWEHATDKNKKLPEHVTKRAYLAGATRALTVLFGILLLSGCAATDSATVKLLLDTLLQVIVLVTTPILLLLLKKGVAIVEQRLNLTLDVRQTDALESALRHAIAYSEEQGRKAISANTALTGKDKKQMAVDFVLNTLQHPQTAEMSKEFIEQLLESRLHLTRK